MLAETANQLYRNSGYHDLISFEEDIAQLSASVVVITESAGSLAELGAFTANDRIRPHVSIVSQTEYPTPSLSCVSGLSSEFAATIQIEWHSSFGEKTSQIN